MSFERWNKFFTETLSKLERERQKKEIKSNKSGKPKARQAGKASTGYCGKVRR